MRISDWSSDVCSSDYVEDIAHAVGRIGQPVTLIGHSMGALVVQRYLERGSAAGAVLPAPVPPTGTAASAAQLLFRYPDYLARSEERRCRERVCQYVSISVVAVSLKKKKSTHS